MSIFMIGVMVLLLSMFAARYINENAIKHLDKDMKAGLVDLFSKQRIYSFIVLLVALGLYFLTTTIEGMNIDMVFMAFGFFMFIYFVVIVISSNRILSRNNYPAPYIKSYLLSTGVRFFGLIVFFTLMFSENLTYRP